MSNLTNKEVVTGFLGIFNHQNYELMYEYFYPNYLDHSLPQVRNIESAIAVLKSAHQAFPDIHLTIEDLIEENNQVAFRGRFRATHLGEFAGLSATGAKVEFQALEIFKLENYKIKESWGYWPSSLIISQIQQHQGLTKERMKDEG